MSEMQQTDAAEECTPTYNESAPESEAVVHEHLQGQDCPQIQDLEPPYSPVRTIATRPAGTGAVVNSQSIVVVSPLPLPLPQPPPQQNQHSAQHSPQQLPLNLHILDSHTTPWGLTATLQLESDTVEIYDRSNEGFQYSLKGNVDLDWAGEAEVLLKDARIDFMGYADTAVLRYEAGGSSSLTTETPVHHTHDFIPTPMVLGTPATAPSSSRDTPPAVATAVATATSTTTTTLAATALATTATTSTTRKRHDSLPIDLTLPGHLPDSTNLAIGKIRYELQVSLEVAFAQGTSNANTESFILRRPVLIHRIVYPSAHLQPRIAQGLDSGGVEIQAKVPRLLHCENTLLAVELYAKPRTRNVKLRKARVVFEQIETDRYQRAPSLAAVPRAVVPLATPALSTNTSFVSATSPSLLHARLPTPQSAGPPPAPRLLTRAIAQPLEVEFEEPTSELQTQNLHLQLVLSPDLCVDIQSSWIQISHTLRVEVEYTTDDDSYIVAPPLSAPPLEPAITGWDISGNMDLRREHGVGDRQQQPSVATEVQNSAATIWDQEGDAIENEDDDEDEPEVEAQSVVAAVRSIEEQQDIGAGAGTGADVDNELPAWALDEKKALPEEEGTGSTALPVQSEYDLENAEASSVYSPDLPVPLPLRPKNVSNLSALSSGSATSSYTYSLATEEIPVRVVRVVSTALVDASTLAQAAGETEAGLPTYESVIEATGLPAYAEEKPEDDQEEAEASGTVTGVLGGAARRLEGEDAELERR